LYSRTSRDDLRARVAEAVPDAGPAGRLVTSLRGRPVACRDMTDTANSAADMLAVAIEEAQAGLAEGGIPIGGALFGADGTLLGRGRNRRVQDGDPSMHAETAAFRAAGRRRTYRGTTMVTTLSPCWYCSGLVRQFGITGLVVGEAATLTGGHDWLAAHGVAVTLLDDDRCKQLMTTFIERHPRLWFEDLGQDEPGDDLRRSP
ncbi:MAG: nucleoside deaminase, partial [Streptosporangiaceae bacterium]